MRLSRNFELKEFTWAEVLGRHIEPNDTQIERVERLCLHVLQPIRDQFGRIVITGGLRNAEVFRELLKRAHEDRRERGIMTPLPSMQSDHFAGDSFYPQGKGAADFRAPQARLSDVFKWIIRSKLPFDQVIHYPDQGFIHINIPPEDSPPRREALIYKDGDFNWFHGNQG